MKQVLEHFRPALLMLLALTVITGGLYPALVSGLDPHLSPAAVLYQAPRVARARGLSLEKVQVLARAHIEGRQWGVLGEPRVNVLRLNLALDELAQPGAGQKAEPK